MSRPAVALHRLLTASLALLAWGVAAFAQDGAAPPPPALTVTSAAVHALEVPRSLTANGSIQAWMEVIIAPEVGGYRVAAVLVDVGAKVRRGEELVQLSGDLLEADLATKAAALAQAKAALIVSQAAERRAESVADSGVYSQADQEKLRSDLTSAIAKVDAAQADVHAAELRLAYTHVRAPDDGVVTSRTVTVGQIAQAGTEMLRLLRQNRIEWHAEIPESRLREIKIGQPVKLTTADGAELTGKVRMVAPTVETQRRTGIVYVDIAQPGTARPGMFARGEIEIARTRAVMVPLMSVVMQDGYSYVFVLTGGESVSRRHVQTGTVRGDQIEIVSGVSPGEFVAEKGAGFLKDGDRVIVSNSAPTTAISTQASR